MPEMIQKITLKVKLTLKDVKKWFDILDHESTVCNSKETRYNLEDRTEWSKWLTFNASWTLKELSEVVIVDYRREHITCKLIFE